MAKLVELIGPGGRCKVSEERAEELLKRKGWKRAPEGKKPKPEDTPPPPPPPDEDDSVDVTAEKIRGMKAAELEKFVKDNELDLDLSEYSNLPSKKDAVIEELELEE